MSNVYFVFLENVKKKAANGCEESLGELKGWYGAAIACRNSELASFAEKALEEIGEV